MLSRFLQVFHRRKLGVFGIVKTGFAILMPNRENAAHRDVGLPVRQFIIVLAERQQTEQDGIDLHRLGCGAAVDVVHADNALIGIAVVAVKELVHV